ncbi:unnamed protein product [Agarophyton chilense]|eukprot:gb/GEZJ01002225.1/.p1 GENE.gb/GEZJ01002225.1/~~gb/GEZJ01002225.1/.p1  ORF type:complete len:424 (+),score=22.32 gb/GEZJ01002225.1/:1130-2401(+)
MVRPTRYRRHRIPVGSRKCYDRFATGWTEFAKEAVNLRFQGTVPLIKVEDPDISPGLSYATPKQTTEVIENHDMETNENSSLALSVMLYNTNEEWKEGDLVDVRTCATGIDRLTRVQVTRQLLMVYNEDLQSIAKGYTRTITDNKGYCYKRGQRNSIFVACHSALISEGMVVCCRCVYNSLERNVSVNEMDVRTQIALKSVITKRSWYSNKDTVIRTSLLYILFFLSTVASSVLIHVGQYEVAVSVLISGLTSWYYLLTWVAGNDTGVTYALTFRGSAECVRSHINMSLGNHGKPIMDPGSQGKHDHLVGTYIVQDKKIEKSIIRFVSAAMCTAKMREVIKPANSCALGSNMGEKTVWDIVMTSKRIRSLGCLLTNKFYVVHTASGLKAFEVTSVSTTARHTNWKEIGEEMVGIIELNHVILG